MLPIRRTSVALGTLVSVVALAASSLTYRATGFAGSAADKQVSIDFVSGPLTDNFFPPLYNGAVQAARDLNVKFKYIPIDESDIETSSARTMQVAIAQHPDAIVVGDFVTSVVDPLIRQAVKQGIPVYVDQSGQDQWQADGAFGFVGQQGPAVGQEAARQFAAHGVKNILCVINVPGNPYLQRVCDGLSQGIKAAHGVSTNLPLPTADSTNPAKVTSDIGAFLQSHRSINAIFCENAAIGTDAVAAVQAANLSGKVHVATMELSKLALADLQGGQIDFLVNEQPYLDGYYGVLFAVQYVKYGLAPVGAVATGPAIIDRTNLAKILQVSKQYPGILGAS